jgi:hypothetical protein
MRSSRGGICATASITPRPMPTRAAWRSGTPRSSPPALNSTIRLTAQTASTPASSVPSMCRKSSSRPVKVNVRCVRPV